MMKKILTGLLLLWAGLIQAQTTPVLPGGYLPFSTQIYRKIAGTDTSYVTGASGKGFTVIPDFKTVKLLQDSLRAAGSNYINNNRTNIPENKKISVSDSILTTSGIKAKRINLGQPPQADNGAEILSNSGSLVDPAGNMVSRKVGIQSNVNVGFDQINPGAYTLAAGVFSASTDNNVRDWAPTGTRVNVSGITGAVQLTGKSGNIPQVAGVLSTVNGFVGANSTVNSARLFDGVFHVGSTVNSAIGLKLDNMNLSGVSSTGIYLTTSGAHPGPDPVGRWGLYDDTGNNQYLGTGNTLINTTMNNGVDKLQVNGSVSTTGLDNYTTDLSAGFTPLSKVSKAYVDANISSLQSTKANLTGGNIFNGDQYFNNSLNVTAGRHITLNSFNTGHPAVDILSYGFGDPQVASGSIDLYASTPTSAWRNSINANPAGNTTTQNYTPLTSGTLLNTSDAAGFARLPIDNYFQGNQVLYKNLDVSGLATFNNFVKILNSQQLLLAENSSGASRNFVRLGEIPTGSSTLGYVNLYNTPGATGNAVGYEHSLQANPGSQINTTNYLPATSGTLANSVDLALKANDNSVVHLAGNETIQGAKNFEGGLFVSTIAVTSELAVAGLTQFNGGASIPVAPIGWSDATNKMYVDNLFSSSASLGRMFAYTTSGDGTTTQFRIPSGLAAPATAIVTAGSNNAMGRVVGGPVNTTGVNFYSTIDGTDIVLTYPNAPSSGTGNLTWSILVK